MSVFAMMSISLDGYVTGPDDRIGQGLGEGGERLHEWIFAGVEGERASSPRTSAGSEQDAGVVDAMFDRLGAIVMGRHSFDVGEGPWGEHPPFEVPCFVVTHRPHETIERSTTTFSFVTEGFEVAVAQAVDAAGDRDVSLHGATMIDQALAAGLLDELQLNVVPVVLGGGKRLFDGLAGRGVELRRTACVQAPDVTHLSYEVLTRPASG